MPRAEQHVKIPGEVKGWRDLVGKVYRSPRFKNPFTFGPFGIGAYEEAARVLIPWPDGLLDVRKEWDVLPHVGHPLTIKLLKKVAHKLYESSGVIGTIRTNGFYRPPGQEWGDGPYADTDGAIDSTDAWGHWRLAIDIAAGATAKSFKVSRDVVVWALLANGFSTPFIDAGEYWHYRPNAAQRERWANV